MEHSNRFKFDIIKFKYTIKQRKLILFAVIIRFGTMIYFHTAAAVYFVQNTEEFSNKV